MSYLRYKMGYNIDYVTVWTRKDNGSKDEYGRPIKDWEKQILLGRWENSLHVVRSWTGDNISSVGNAILPVLLDIREEIQIEKGSSQGTEPSSEAKKVLSFEEITQIRLPAKEWIYYV